MTFGLAAPWPSARASASRTTCCPTGASSAWKATRLGTSRGAAYAPNGAQAGIDRTSLDDRGQFPDIAVQGADAYIAGLVAGPSAVVRLPAGANWVDPAAWQHLPDVNGEQPELRARAARPWWRCSSRRRCPSEELFTQRWTGLRWTAPVDVGGVSYDSSFALAGSGTRLTGVWAVAPPGLPVPARHGHLHRRRHAVVIGGDARREPHRALHARELSHEPGRPRSRGQRRRHQRPPDLGLRHRSAQGQRGPCALRRHHPRQPAHRPGRLRQRAARAPARAGRARGRPREPERRAAQRARPRVAARGSCTADAGRRSSTCAGRRPSARPPSASCRATGARRRCAWPSAAAGASPSRGPRGRMVAPMVGR